MKPSERIAQIANERFALRTGLGVAFNECDPRAIVAYLDEVAAQREPAQHTMGQSGRLSAQEVSPQRNQVRYPDSEGRGTISEDSVGQRAEEKE